MRTWHMAAVGMMAAAILACGGASSATDAPTNTPTSPGETTPTATNVVSLNPDLTFAPSTISVPAGTTVTWEWNSCAGGASGGYGTCISHSVVFDDGSNISSAVLDTGTFTRTFAAAGTYKYHCGVHGASMSGEVVVH